MTNKVYNIITSTQLTYDQKVLALSREAENTLDVLDYSSEAKDFINKGIICDLFEGNAPYRPRYILPDYEKLFNTGCKFLGLYKPNDLYEAINNLLIFYKHVPSITSFPVYIGNLDKLLEPFYTTYEDTKKLIKLLLIHIDKTLTDSFIQLNIGPKKTKIGEIILELSKELQLPTPNITMLYDSELTEDDFMEKCLDTALQVAKPSFANHKMFQKEFINYGIASCYNGLEIGGGGYTLIRIKLGTLASYAKSIDDFFNNWLPKAIELQLEIIDKRIKFIVEESHFFTTHFLAKEGFINKDNFTGMFGIVGLAECVNTLLKNESLKFGHSEKADVLGEEIIKFIDGKVNHHKGIYCHNLHDKYILHAQVGIDTDKNESPGCRIPIGEEPELYKHLIQTSRYHKYFKSGIGDIFVFNQTYYNNLSSLLDIVRGALNNGLRYLSLYSENTDVVRVSGYLVKRSEMEKLDRGETVLRNTTALGKGARDYGKALDRKVRD